MWCIGELTGEYIERMEDILNLYERPYRRKEPVICFDEKMHHLVSDVRSPLPMKRGFIKRRDYEYKRKGSCNIFCVIEPKAGRHLTYVTKNRKAVEFAKVIRRIEGIYSKVKKVHIVLDNLNTHVKKSLLGYYGEEEGQRIWERFEWHYTPKHASWLNQVEIEIGLYQRGCIGRERIGNIDELRVRTKAWNRRMNIRKVKINWKFTSKKARKKFKYSFKTYLPKD